MRQFRDLRKMSPLWLIVGLLLLKTSITSSLLEEKLILIHLKDDELMDRQKRNAVVLVRCVEEKVGMEGVITHLQCSAGLHRPIVSQLAVEGAGPEADDSQGEFSVRQRENVREKVSECSRVKQLFPVLQDSAYSRAATFLLIFLNPFLCSAPKGSSPFSSFFLFATLLCNFGFSVVNTGCCLLFVLHSTFPYIPLSALVLYLLVFFFFSPCGWIERLFLTPVHSPPPSIHHIPWASVHLAGKRRMCVSVGRCDSHRQLEVCLETAPGVLRVAEVF